MTVVVEGEHGTGELRTPSRCVDLGHGHRQRIRDRILVTVGNHVPQSLDGRWQQAWQRHPQ